MVSGGLHSRNGCLPVVGIEEIENDQVLLSRSTTGNMPVLMRELQVVARMGRPEYDTIKSLVILERGEYRESNSVNVEPDHFVNMVCRTCNAKFGFDNYRREDSKFRRQAVKARLPLVAELLKLLRRQVAVDRRQRGSCRKRVVDVCRT